MCLLDVTTLSVVRLGTKNKQKDIILALAVVDEGDVPSHMTTGAAALFFSRHGDCVSGADQLGFLGFALQMHAAIYLAS